MLYQPQTCQRCPALCASRNTIVNGVGPYRPALFIIGEAPGANEDAQGIPFVGRSGQLLRATLGELGLDPSKDVFYTNVVRCHPEGNRDPTSEERANCRPYLWDELTATQPRAILAAGKIADNTVDGFPEKLKSLGIPVFRAWHPAYALRNPSKRTVWKAQLQAAINAALARPQPVPPGVDPWYLGTPDSQSAWLACDTETDDLTEGVGVKRITYQVSDGGYAVVRDDDSDPRHYGTGHLWFHFAKYDAPLVGIDLRKPDTWDDTALMAYVLRRERVGLKVLGPAETGLEMTPIKAILTGTEKVYRHAKKKPCVWCQGTGNEGACLGCRGTGRHMTVSERKVARPFSAAWRDDRAAAEQYAALDAVVTSRLARKLYLELTQSPRQLAYYHDIEKPMTPVLYDMERSGVLIDVDACTVLDAHLRSEQATAHHNIIDAIGLGHTPAWYWEGTPPLNIQSTEQLAAAIQAAGFPLTKRTPKTGKLQLDEQALLELAGVDAAADIDPATPVGYLTSNILRYRELQKLRSTYVSRLIADRDEHGRIHARFNQAVAATNRLSSSEPNLQNIPIRGSIGKTLRRVFIAKPGYSFVKADYSQLEVRIYAHYTNEPILVAAYHDSANERDVHQGVADALGIPRPDAKNVLFGAIYGAESAKLAATAGVPAAEAAGFLANMRQQLPSLLTWQQNTGRILARDGYLETLLGWRNYYPAFLSPVRREQQAALREAANFRIQGTASGVVKLLMIAMDKIAPAFDASLVLTVHDEVVYEVLNAAVPEFAAILTETGAAVGRGLLNIPLRLDVGAGPNWGDTYPINEWQALPR